MKRATIVVPMMMGLVAGALLAGTLVPAEAQRRGPAPVARGDCEETLAQRDHALRRARRQVTQAEARARNDRAEAAAQAAEMQLRIAELEKRLELEQRRMKRLEQQLGAPLIEDIDFR